VSRALPEPSSLAARLLAARTEPQLAEVCAPDLHYEDPFTAAPLHGVAQLARHRARLDAAFPDAQLALVAEPLTDGSRVVLGVAFAGRQSGLTEELPRLDRPVELHVVAWCELRDGRFARVRVFADRWSAAEQLGVLPTPGSLAARALSALQGFGLR
jgi:ketosteroid isomerase-like protein